MRNQKSILTTGVLSLVFMMTLPFMQSCDNTNNDMFKQVDDLQSLQKEDHSDWGLSRYRIGDLPDPCKQVCLVAGQHMYVGTVDVAVMDGNLLVTYNISEPGIYLTEIHLDIFTSIDQLKSLKKISHGGAIPGKFAYSNKWSKNDMVTTFTVEIPQSYIEEVAGSDPECIYIASHAALSNGQTAWGGICDETDNGVSLDNAKQFPGANWSVFFEFCFDECQESIDFTYAWEDLRNSGNDADYNDLVIQSDVIKSSDELKITFLATARGAAYAHEFKIKIPKTGITGIYGEDSFTSDADYYYITVFGSTKVALPEEGENPYPFSANTVVRESGCTPFAYTELVLTIDGSFSYDATKPYEPFITVYPSEEVGVGNHYDLYIYDVSGRDTWTKDGEEYPNGILIPRDWQWPLERTHITLGYPDFTSLTAGWTANWADNLADTSKVFDKSICE